MRATKRYSCDFETITDPNDARVWAWIAIDIDMHSTIIIDNSIESFFKWLNNGESKTCYFHNLKFDGSYILDHALKHGFTVNPDSYHLQPMQLSTLISDKGMFYTMMIKFDHHFVRFVDSLKILPYSVDAIAKGWKLPQQKLKIDYDAYRAPGHELTPEERQYIINDAMIVAKALKILFNDGYNKITAGSNAFGSYVKNSGGKKSFRRVFPPPENDAYIRKAYKGGFTYVNPSYQDQIIGAGRVYDVNSLYPFAMHSPNAYPYGEAVYYTGEYEYDPKYPLYVQTFYCDFKLKPGHLPTLQRKNTPGYIPTQYLTESISDEYPITLCSIDLQLFREHYDIENYRPVDGYKYKSRVGMFDEYIDQWYETKRQSKEEGNYAKYQLSKLFLNSFYGKFATNPHVGSMIPEITEDGILNYKAGAAEEKTPIYIAVGVFCTAYARDKTIRAAQSCYDRFLYADTDSLHVLGDEPVPGLDVDDFKLGAWKLEDHFTQAKYLRAKLYMENMIQPDGSTKWTIKGAGMTDAIKSQITLDNFHPGATFDGKLTQKMVKGGMILDKTTFTILK